ncbi:MAG: hypothetical protein ACR2H2_09020 [Solirubrobacteraceae bacterium]
MAGHAPTSIRPHLAIVAVLAALAVAALAGPSAAHAASCTPPKYPGSGYFTSLAVTNASCATGRRLVKAYYSCRIRKGKTGRCTRKVLGYSCKETKRVAIPTELNGRVSCKRGARRIVHTYQQNL